MESTQDPVPSGFETNAGSFRRGKPDINPPADRNPGLTAPSLLGVTPRLIGMPGYTGQVTYGLTAPVVSNQGSGYTDPLVAFTPPGATATATMVSGKVTAINLTSPGDYQPGTHVTVAVTDGNKDVVHSLNRSGGFTTRLTLKQPSGGAGTDGRAEDASDE